MDKQKAVNNAAFYISDQILYQLFRSGLIDNDEYRLISRKVAEMYDVKIVCLKS